MEIRVDPLAHPVRRDVLRLLGDSRWPLSTAELAQRLGCSRRTILYHLGILNEEGALSELKETDAEGSFTRRWASSVKDDEDVNAMLAKTLAGDRRALERRLDAKRTAA